MIILMRKDFCVLLCFLKLFSIAGRCNDFEKFQEKFVSLFALSILIIDPFFNQITSFEKYLISYISLFFVQIFQRSNNCCSKMRVSHEMLEG